MYSQQHLIYICIIYIFGEQLDIANVDFRPYSLRKKYREKLRWLNFLILINT